MIGGCSTGQAQPVGSESLAKTGGGGREESCVPKGVQAGGGRLGQAVEAPEVPRLTLIMVC